MTEIKTEDSSAQLRVEQASVNRLSGALPDSKAHLIFWSLAMGGLLLDLWSKKAVFEWLNQENLTVFQLLTDFYNLSLP